MNTDQKKSLLLATILDAAREEGLQAADRKDDAGEVMAWYRVLELAKDEAEALGLPLAEIGLSDYDPAELLRRANRAA
jgi:hypothetical protein